MAVAECLRDCVKSRPRQAGRKRKASPSVGRQNLSCWRQVPTQGISFLEAKRDNVNICRWEYQQSEKANTCSQIKSRWNAAAWKDSNAEKTKESLRRKPNNLFFFCRRFRPRNVRGKVKLLAAFSLCGFGTYSIANLHSALSLPIQRKHGGVLYGACHCRRKRRCRQLDSIRPLHCHRLSFLGSGVEYCRM